MSTRQKAPRGAFCFWAVSKRRLRQDSKKLLRAFVIPRAKAAKWTATVGRESCTVPAGGKNLEMVSVPISTVPISTSHNAGIDGNRVSIYIDGTRFAWASRVWMNSR